MIRIKLKPEKTGPSRRTSGVVWFLVIAFFILCMPVASHAHKVNIYAYAEDGKVHAEGYFIDGSPCKNSPVEVYDAKKGGQLLTGSTDDEGMFSFDIPAITSFRLILDAGTGHKNDFTVTEAEVREAMGMSVQDAENQNPEVREEYPENGDAGRVGQEPGGMVSSAEVEAVVERVMDRKLKPLTRMLVNMQEKMERPGLSEILGGIGYIIGLMGIVMYFKSKKR